ncbi:MAG: FMN-dependent NADH-azoreductase [Candidatus Puniceispirillaceae bacterium]
MSRTPKTILRVDASMRKTKSVSRRLADEMVAALGGRSPDVEVVNRDLTCGVGLVNDAWIDSDRTPEEMRTQGQRVILAQSDALVSELQAADDIVIAVPIYNFSVPAAFKAWIDLVCRTNITFVYENDKPRGMLTDKRAFVVITSGGTLGGSEIDYTSGYVKHILSFIGITDVTFVDATGLSKNRRKVIADASKEIAKIGDAASNAQRNLSAAE